MKVDGPIAPAAKPWSRARERATSRESTGSPRPAGTPVVSSRQGDSDSIG
jgi:hypothetical protein